MGKGAAAGNKECFRITLWMCWVTNMLITTIYYIMSAVTFYKLLVASGEVLIDTSGSTNGTTTVTPIPSKDQAKALVMNRVWRAPLAACILASLLVFGFNLFSCCVLIKKSINRSGPGFGYGFLVAFCFSLAFFCLLVGLIMDSFRGVLKQSLEGLSSWTKYSTELYVGTEVFAFLCFAMFILFFLALVIFQSAVSDQLGISQDMSNPYVPMEVPPLAGVGVAAGAAAGTMAMATDGKMPASDDPGYAQYSATDYMSSDQYYQQYSTQYQPADYQNTTEYVYDQQQGYQDAYGVGVGGTTAAAGAAASTPAYTAPPAYQAAPAYQASDYNAASAAAYQQGVYTGNFGAAPLGRTEQQL